jgi:hypothetical protein
MTETAETTPEQLRAIIEAAPLPGDGEPIYERGLPTGMDEDGGYALTANSLAHALLVLAEEDPTLLDLPTKEEDPSGFERANNSKLWEAFKTRWPEGNDWLGGPTGFQYGWAHNAVRYVLGREETGNPAILTIGAS